jgi:hypothetical protein
MQLTFISKISPLPAHILRVGDETKVKQVEQKTSPRSSSPSQKKQVTEGHSNSWLNNLGFGFYAAAGLTNKFPRLARSINHSNPSGVVGALANISCYPFLFAHRDLNTKLYLQFGNHISGMARQAKNFNDNLTQEHMKAKYLNSSTIIDDAIALPNMKEWFEGGLLKRTLMGKMDASDKANWKKCGRYLVEDQINGLKNLILTLKHLGKLGVSVLDKARHPHSPFVFPDELKIMAKRVDSEKRLILNNKAHYNNYVFQHGLTFGSMGIIATEAVMRMLGLHHITGFITTPLNVALNGVQTVAKLTEDSATWHGISQKTGKRPWFYRPMVMGRWVSAYTSFIGCVAWNNDFFLGLFRLGAVAAGPLEIFKSNFAVKGNKPIVAKDGNIWTKLIKGTKVPSIMLDAAAAACILGTPLVQGFQNKHRVNLNPFDKDSIVYLPKEERDHIWARVHKEQRQTKK